MTLAEGDAPRLDAVLEVLTRRGFDFRDYGRETLARRLEERIAQVGARDARRYEERLERDPREVERLADHLLVHFTAFFRDPAAFEAVERAIPSVRRAGEVLRAWVVGAATGEEAFSLALLLARAETGTASFDVLATDRDEGTLAVARAARYGDDAVARVPAALRERFFEREAGGWRVSARLRARVRFAVHDFLGPRLAPREAVLPSFDLVLMRNVLVYLDDRSRALAARRLAAVVREGGALVLGHVESLATGAGDAFEPYPDLDPGSRIFRRRRT